MARTRQSARFADNDDDATAALPDTSDTSDTPASRNPYGLAPAPIRRERPSAPADLGDYGAEELRGWVVIFSRDVEFAVYRDLREMMQASREAKGEAGLEVLETMLSWLERILLAWNFVDSAGRPLPQPREGGCVRCPMAALGPIARAFAQSVTPPKA